MMSDPAGRELSRNELLAVLAAKDQEIERHKTGWLNCSAMFGDAIDRAEAAEREVAQARKTAEYWKAEHNAANTALAAEQDKAKTLREWLKAERNTPDDEHKTELGWRAAHAIDSVLNKMDALGFASTPAPQNTETV